MSRNHSIQVIKSRAIIINRVFSGGYASTSKEFKRRRRSGKHRPMVKQRWGEWFIILCHVYGINRTELIVWN